MAYILTKVGVMVKYNESSKSSSGLVTLLQGQGHRVTYKNAGKQIKAIVFVFMAKIAFLTV